MRKLCHRSFTILIGVLLSIAGLASVDYFPELEDPLFEPWRWQYFPELEGKGVHCIVEDDQGNVWFGVNHGIIEYSGYTFTLHNAENGLGKKPIEQIHATSRGRIFAASTEGLYVLENDIWKLLFSFQNRTVLTEVIVETANGGIALCTNLGLLSVSSDLHLSFITSSTIEPFGDDPSTDNDDVEWITLPDEIWEDSQFSGVSDLLRLDDDRWWMSVMVDRDSRILEFDPANISEGVISEYRVIDSPGPLPFGESMRMLKLDDGTIWLTNTSTNIGIYQFDGTWNYEELGDIFGGDEFTTDIMQSSDGAVWIGGLGKLHTWKDGKWSLYTSPEFRIPANRIIISKSKYNNLWIGGEKSKVYRLDYSPKRWLTYKNLNYQAESSRNVQWFLDVSGKVVKRIGDHWTAFGPEDGMIDAPVRVFVSREGQVWVAGSHDGVAATAVLDGTTWMRHLHPELSWGIDYRAVFEARDGSLWFGGSVDFVKEKGQYGGVLQLTNPRQENLQWIHHKYNENGLIQSNAYGIGQSKDGRIWIGGGNLFYYDGVSWNRPEIDELQQYVNIVHSTGDLLFIGSRFYGIYIYDGEEFIHYDTDNGLTSNTIISLFSGKDNKIWAATDSDISCFDGQTWVNNIFPEEMNMQFEGGEVIQSSDGVVWINKSPREWKRRSFSHQKDTEGMYQGFQSYRYVPDRNPPETRIQVYSDRIPYHGNHLVSWTGEDLFGGTQDSRLFFSYRLNGGPWSSFSTDKHQTFLNLDNGNYTLEVRARDLDFNVDRSPAKIEFEVLPPVWKQGWFILLVVTFVITIVVFEYRMITKKQKLEKLNASLNTINTELKHKNEQVLQQQDQIMEQKRLLETNYKNLEEQTDEIQTQRDQLETMVKQIEDLSQSKLNFFTNISHELRTPLTLISGPIEQLQHEDLSLSETEKKRLREIIDRNASRLLKLINQLLEIRRIENSTLELKLMKGNLGQFLDEIMSLFENLSRVKQIQFSFDNQTRNALVAFDPDKVEKILVNLISNAFNHTPEGGKIAVLLKEDFSGGERSFVIVVEDNGSGICSSKIEHIFDRYYTDSMESWSSGIGLAYIKDLVELHSGIIDVESNEDVGTRFIFRFPDNLDFAQKTEKLLVHRDNLNMTNWEVNHLMAIHSTQRAERLETTQAASNKKSVLVVEDNEDMVDFLEGILQSEYVVHVAYNGEDGLRIAENQSIDLIVSDIMMPGMDGLTLCDRLKKGVTTSHIPVILLTARNLDEDVVEGYHQGADDYISKPFNSQLLKVRISNLLTQRERLWSKFTRDFTLEPRKIKLESPDEELLNRIVEIMEENMSDSGFNVNKMCEMVHLSHMHFIRKVKQLTGKKPIDLLKSYRLKRAKDLLKQNKTNISEIAYMVGYDLPNSFSRAFKKEYGYSPSEYIASLQQVAPSIAEDN